MKKENIMKAKRPYAARVFLALCMYVLLLLCSALLAIGVEPWPKERGDQVAIMALLNIHPILLYWLFRVMARGMEGRQSFYQDEFRLRAFNTCLTTREVFRMVNRRITRELVEETIKRQR